MTDQRFFRSAGPISLGEIAQRIGGELSDPAAADLPIRDLAPLDLAGDGDISVFTGAPYAGAFAGTRASAVVTTRKLAAQCCAGRRMIYVPQPRLAYAQICSTRSRPSNPRPTRAPWWRRPR
jgi:UDP-3-O-[3-hydroxymyristoyl] glucosamine N-acyltransferase